MNFITTALNKLFKSSNQQELNKIKPLVQKINNLEKDFLNLTPEKFVEKTNQLKKNMFGHVLAWIPDSRHVQPVLGRIFQTESEFVVKNIQFLEPEGQT